MKKIISAILIILILVSIASLILVGCCDDAKPKRYSCEIEVTNENIDGLVRFGDAFVMKYDGKPKFFNIKIYSIDEKKYLTNQDMERGNLTSLIVVLRRKDDETNGTRLDVNDSSTWPTEVGFYQINIDFNEFGLQKYERDPKYKGPPSIAFDLIIREGSENGKY